MPHIDWDAEQTGNKKAGIYHAEVTSSQQKFGQTSGDEYFLVKFTDVDDQQTICFDVLSFGPRALNLTISKLKAFGFTKATKTIEASDLVGRRVWISTKIEAQDGYDPRLVVDISAKNGFRAGYKPESAAEQESMPTDVAAKEVDDDLPF